MQHVQTFLNRFVKIFTDYQFADLRRHHFSGILQRLCPVIVKTVRAASVLKTMKMQSITNSLKKRHKLFFEITANNLSKCHFHYQQLTTSLSLFASPSAAESSGELLPFSFFSFSSTFGGFFIMNVESLCFGSIIDVLPHALHLL